MRFMMLVIPEGYGEAEPGTVPDGASLTRNEREREVLLRRAGESRASADRP